MSDRTGDLEPAVEQAQQGLPEAERKLFGDFARAFLRDADPHTLRMRGTAGAVALARGAYDFASLRKGELSVRVRNPEASPGRTVIEILLGDRPFLVDTTRMLLREQGLREDCFLHPVIPISRDESGQLRSVGSGELEAVLRLELAPQAPAPEELERDLHERLTRLVAVTDDHRKMIRTIRELAANVEFAKQGIEGRWERADKIRRFLDWLVDGSFVFVGLRSYTQRLVEGEIEASIRAGTGLGLLRADSGSRLAQAGQGAELPGELRDQLSDDRIILISKARIESTIHRSGRLDRILVKEHDENGQVIGFVIALGLFTFRALRTPGSQIPLLAERLDAILTRNEAPPGSHRYKAVVSVFDSTPAEFLLASEPDAIGGVIDDIIAAEGHDQARLITAADPERRSLYAAVVLPRHRYREELEGEIRELLYARLGEAEIDHRTSFLEGDAALLSYFCTAAAGRRLELPDRAELEEAVGQRVAGWPDRLAEGLIRSYGDAAGLRLAACYEEAFPEAYRVGTHPSDAVRDVGALESLAQTGALQFRLYFDADGARDTNTLKIFMPESRLLSDLLPAVDRFGIRVVDASQAEIRAAERPTAVVVALRVLPLGGDADDLDALAEPLAAALRAALTGVVADDTLNGLVLLAGLDWREVDCLRAYLEYFNQLQGTLTRPHVRDVLLGNPSAARLLLDYHRARLDPAIDPDVRVEREDRVRVEFEVYRVRVTSLNDDRALGGLYELIHATLRTTFFADCAGPHQIAIKLDPGRIEEVSAPRPYREIFVHGSGVTGIHIRGGPIARGGLRFSDRADDLRTEVLGLMRTQTLKNGLIVPVGAKGGFVTKGGEQAGLDPRTHADQQYRHFIAGLLDLTDDLDGEGRVVPPRGVHRRDGDDPYLVVAADKGTAHLSDAANAVALERGFWLGDAFASGGSNGYDHKKFAITARGAWECAKHHFYELGIDPESDSYSAVGIGDMSGDVFGNGLLLARRARLLAAFDHRHVFLDPEPDPEVAWRERRRLFDLPRSSWADYDSKKISAGGGVFPRDAKQIPLAAAMRTALGLEREEATGEEVVRAILRMPADLLWNGGIGTYVKARGETHSEVQDRATDAVRVNADELRVRVVAEGGNLGLTQLARIEASLGGVHMNMDATDNSAGVDLSDHEVNYKVLLAPLVRSGRLSDEERNALLAGVADEACERVLAHNRAQALCLSLDAQRSRNDPEPFLWAIEYLCDAEGVAPEEGRLPDAATLEAREGGLVRPELAWLLGLAKLHLRRSLLEGDWAQHACAEPLYRSYFPDSFIEAYPEAVDDHRLRAEITALAVTNRLIDQGGITLIPSLVRELDVGPDVAGMMALTASDLLADLDYREQVLAPSNIPREEIYRALLDLDDSSRGVARVLARRSWQDVRSEDIVRWRHGLAEILAHRSEFPTDNAFARGDERLAELRSAGFSDGLARTVAGALLADLALSLIWVGERSETPLWSTAFAYAHLGEHSGINHLYERLDRMSPSDPWDRIELVQLRSETIDLHGALAEQVLGGQPNDPVAAARDFLARRAPAIARVRSLQQRALGADRPSSLAVIAKALQRLLHEA